MPEITPPAPDPAASAPAAAVTPPADVTPPATDPVAPADPPAATEPKKEDTEPTAEEKDQQEWDDAAKDLFPGLKDGDATKKVEEPKKDEPPKPDKKPETPKEDKTEPKETPEQKAEREAKEKAAQERAESEAAARNTRMAARSATQQVEAIKGDVRKKMFPDISPELVDADGDPIRSVEDVMGLVNSKTGAAFTREEASAWLTAAQREHAKSYADAEKQIKEISELNSDIKDQADAIKAEFGDILAANPDLRKELWDEYERSLVKDEATGIIIKAPMSLERFYRMVLTPYAKANQQKAATPPAITPPADTPAEPSAEEKAEAEKKKKEAAEAKRRKERQDRSDIYGGALPETKDPEDKEWEDAAKEVFGDRLNK